MQYEDVKKNKLLTGMTIFIFMIAVYLLSYFVFNMLNFGRVSLIISAMLATISTIATYWYSAQIVLAMVKARPPLGTEEHYINESLKNLCIAAGIKKTPQLYIVESNQINAFATGRNLENSVICLTTGIINRLDKVELEAVIAHELTHIINNDMRVTTIISVMAGFITILSDVALRYSRFSYRSSDSESESSIMSVFVMILGLIALVFSPIITSIVQLFISRKREYMADAGSVALTRNPESLVSALIKIHEDSEKMDVPTNAVQGLFISNPDPTKKLFTGKSSIFSSHPSLEERVTAIRNLK